jgi:hypothetical protein
VLKAMVVLIALVASTSVHAQPTSAWSQPGTYQAPQSTWNEDNYRPPKSQPLRWAHWRHERLNRHLEHVFERKDHQWKRRKLTHDRSSKTRQREPATSPLRRGKARGTVIMGRDCPVQTRSEIMVCNKLRTNYACPISSRFSSAKHVAPAVPMCDRTLRPTKGPSRPNPSPCDNPGQHQETIFRRRRKGRETKAAYLAREPKQRGSSCWPSS